MSPHRPVHRVKAALFVIPKKWKQPKCLSANGWINSEQIGVYLHNEMLLSNKK